MSEIVHLIIKKDYAASLIQHLQREDAVEIIKQQEPSVPEWQKEAVRKTLADAQQHPELLQSWDVVKEKYRRS